VARADPFGPWDLKQRRLAFPDREEQLGIDVAVGGVITPVRAVVG
jgi:hypothetical protein